MIPVLLKENLAMNEKRARRLRVSLPALAIPILIMSWLGLLLCNTDRYAWSNVAVVAGRDFALSPIFALSIFATAAQIGFLISVILGGLATDWLGARRIMGAAVTLMGIATFLFGASSSMLVGVTLQFAIGLAAGPIFSAGVKLISTWFGQVGRATAMGFYMTATSLAIVMANSVVPRLAKMSSWRTAFFYLGAVTVVSGLLSILVVRDAAGDEPEYAPPIQLAAKLMRNKNFKWLAIANLGGPWGGYGFAVWTPTLLVDKFHVSLAQAGLVVATFGLGSVAAKILIGFFSDVIGGYRKVLTVIFLCICCAGLLGFGYSNSLLAFQIAAPMLGIAALSYSPLLNTMIAESAKGMAGSAAGFSLALTILGESIQPSLVAVVYQMTKSFPLIFAIFAAGPLIAVYALTRVDSSIK